MTVTESDGGELREPGYGIEDPEAVLAEIPYPPGSEPGTPGYRIGDAETLLAVIPHLLGFQPEASFVIVGAVHDDGSVKVAIRYGLPDPPDPDAVTDLAGHAADDLHTQRLTLAWTAGYGPARLVDPVTAAFADWAQALDICVAGQVRTEAGRYWSCAGPGPAAGIVSEAAIAAAGSGQPAVSRDELAATFSPAGEPDASAMSAATRQARTLLLQQISLERQAGPGHEPSRVIAAAGLPVITELMAAYRAGGRYASHLQVATLTVTLASMRVRDDAWARMDSQHAEAHLRMWTDVTRLAQPGYIAPAASLAAFAAWQLGHGTLANLALDRAAADDPDYSMAAMIRKYVTAGLDPIPLPMTPAQVAASYEHPPGDQARRPAIPARPGPAASAALPRAGTNRSRPATPGTPGQATPRRNP